MEKRRLCPEVEVVMGGGGWGGGAFAKNFTSLVYLSNDLQSCTFSALDAVKKSLGKKTLCDVTKCTYTVARLGVGSAHSLHPVTVPFQTGGGSGQNISFCRELKAKVFFWRLSTEG